MHGLLTDEFPAYFERRLRVKRAPFMVPDVNTYLGCGDIKRSSATLECLKCSYRRDIPLSCKRRSFCEPCLVRRQLDRSTFLHREVFGETPVRLWTTTLPHPLRTALGANADLLTRVLTAINRRIMRYIRLSIKHSAKLDTVANVYPGAVTSIQRVSSALDPNIHLHALFTDGAFVMPASGEPVTFERLVVPTDDDVARLARDICEDVEGVLVDAGRWEAAPSEEPHVLSGMFITHDGQKILCRMTGVAAQQRPPEGVGAFNLDASRAVAGGDAVNLLKMIKYLLAPAIRDKRLTRRSGSVILELKRPRIDGTTHREYRTDQFLDRLNFMVPPPRANLIRFHGAYAPNAKVRAEAVPKTPPVIPCDLPPDPEMAQTPDDHRAWSELKSHAFAKDIMRCPICSGRLQLMALRTDTFTYRRRSPSSKALRNRLP